MPHSHAYSLKYIHTYVHTYIRDRSVEDNRNLGHLRFATSLRIYLCVLPFVCMYVCKKQNAAVQRWNRTICEKLMRQIVKNATKYIPIYTHTAMHIYIHTYICCCWVCPCKCPYTNVNNMGASRTCCVPTRHCASPLAYSGRKKADTQSFSTWQHTHIHIDTFM